MILRREGIMVEQQANQFNRKQTIKGTSDARLTPLKDEPREIASKGVKPGQELETGHETVSDDALQEESEGKEGSGGDKGHSGGDVSRQNSDDEMDARGGLMGGSSAIGSRRAVS
jgi:hypothetical protein